VPVRGVGGSAAASAMAAGLFSTASPRNPYRLGMARPRSVAVIAALFADFKALMGDSDFLESSIIGLRAFAFPMRIGSSRSGQLHEIPVPEQGTSEHAGFYDHAAPKMLSRANEHFRVAFRIGFGVGARKVLYEPQFPVCACPDQRFADVLTGAAARLVVLAGLPAHGQGPTVTNFATEPLSSSR
jgi:hypothetical protein